LGTLNFLEAYAAALTGGLFPKITRDIVREKLIDSIAVITGAPAWLVKLREAVTSETTFQLLEAIRAEGEGSNSGRRKRTCGLNHRLT
jgi:hypothetical protein